MRRATKTRRPKLRLESLENRALLTVTYNPALQVVELDGTNGNDTFNCYQQVIMGKDSLVVEEGTGPGKLTFTFSLSVLPVIGISADLRDGADVLTCNETVGIPVSAAGGLGGDNIRGGNQRDVLMGDDGNDQLEGGNGADVINGGNHNDTIFGNDGHDIIDGGAENDSIAGGKGNDQIQGWWGRDRIHGDDGDDTIFGHIDDDMIWGDQGFDYIDGGRDSDDQIWGGTEDDTLLGSEGNDTIFGESGQDLISGGQGADRLDGGVGRDTLNGGTERDQMIGGNGDDELDGGDHADTLWGDGVGATSPGNDLLHGGAGNDRLNGDKGNDQVVGDAGNDTLTGGDGNDEVRGGAGNDIVRGGNGNDRVYGGGDNDRLFGDNHNDQLFGDQGIDRLDGGGHDDTLVSIDNDTVDVLWGRAGFDSFWVDNAGAINDDIRDESANEAETNLHFVDFFENGADKSLDGDTIADPAGAQAFAEFGEQPLFSSVGPAVTDIKQGNLNDCWLLSSLATAVNISPNVARQLVVDLGDGTFAVHIETGLLNNQKFYRVDASLPVAQADPSQPLFAGFGAEDSLWVALVEKAMAMEKGNDYGNLNNDTAYFPLGRIGGANRNLYHISDGEAVLGDIAANGWGGVYITRLDQADVHDTVAAHAYGIIAVLIGMFGTPTGVVLYNPHGIDNTPLWNADGTPMLDDDGAQMFGSVDGADDGFVTLTIEQFANDAQEPVGAITADFGAYN